MIKEKLKLTKNTILNFDYNTFFKVKFKFNNELKTGVLFFDKSFFIYSNDIIYNFKDVKIKKIYNKFELNDGSQIKFKFDNKIERGFVHYFDIQFLYCKNDILVINYFNYDDIRKIKLDDIIGNDFSIID